MHVMLYISWHIHIIIYICIYLYICTNYTFSLLLSATLPLACFLRIKKENTFVFYPTVCDKQVSPDVLCYNAMLSTLEKAEQWSLALELFSTFSSSRRSHGRLLRFFRVLKKDGNRPGHHWNKICRRYSWRSYSCEFWIGFVFNQDLPWMNSWRERW